MRNLYITFGCFFFLSCLQAQQLPIPLASVELGYQWNPAMTAMWNEMDIRIQGQKQWLGYTGAPQTAGIGIQRPFARQNMAIGGAVLYDKTGPLAYTGATLSYRYSIEPGLTFRDHLHFGIGVHLGSFAFNAAEARLIQPDDALVNSSNSSAFDYNISAGVFYNTGDGMDKDRSNLYGGIALQKAIPHTLSIDGSTQAFNHQQVLQTNIVAGAHVAGSTFYWDHTVWVNTLSPGLFNVSYHVRCEYPEVFYTGLYMNTGFTFGIEGGVLLGARSWDGGMARLGVLAQTNIGSAGKYQGFTPGVELAWIKEL